MATPLSGMQNRSGWSDIMGPQPIFLLDANAFIESAKRFYALDIAPGYWNSLIKNATIGRVRSIDRIKIEIDKGQDHLTTWTNTHFSNHFESTNQPDVIGAYVSVMRWAQSQKQYTNAAQAEFASNADGWLVAHALAKRYVVVTLEQYNADIKKRIKIPNACQGVGVSNVTPFEMLRILKVRLELIGIL